MSNVHDFDPDIVDTVSPNDLWVVEFLGLLGAALAGAGGDRPLASTPAPATD